MITIATGISKHLLVRENSLQAQCVRYLRKPRWIGIAKTKMYKILEDPPKPRFETEEIKRITDLYQSYNNSLWMFQKHIYEEQVAKSQSDAKEISEDVDLERILVENEKDNAKVRALREQQIQDDWKRVEEEIIKEKQLRDLEELVVLESTEKRIQSEMERLKTVITEDMLDEAIDKALAVEVDYNYAIDKDGLIYRGRRNHDKPEPLETRGKPLRVRTSDSVSKV